MFVIHNWDKFETNRTRALKNLSWVPVPNDLSSDGYTELMEHEDGASYFGVFIACVEVASKCHPRGTLVRRDGTPHDFHSLSRLTRIPAAKINEGFSALLNVGWIEYHEDGAVVQHRSAGIRHPSAGKTSTKERKKGMNGKKGKKGKKTPDDSRHRQLFDLWFKLHEARYHHKPTVSGASPKVIKLLAGIPDGDRILRAWYADDDQFIVKNGHSLQLLPARIDGVRASLGPAPSDISEDEAAKLVAEINERQNP